MYRTIGMALVMAAALIAAPQAADAQAREGFFIGVGVGGGSFGCPE